MVKKIQQHLPEPLTSEAAYWGRKLEEIVACEFTLRTNKKVRGRTQIFKHAIYPFLQSNIDRDVVGEHALLEYKPVTILAGVLMAASLIKQHK